MSAKRRRRRRRGRSEAAVFSPDCAQAVKPHSQAFKALVLSAHSQQLSAFAIAIVKMAGNGKGATPPVDGSASAAGAPAGLAAGGKGGTKGPAGLAAGGKGGAKGLFKGYGPHNPPDIFALGSYVRI